MMSWDWQPGVSIGRLFFGGELSPDSLGVPVERLPPSCEEADWETYRIGDEQGRISVDSGKIVSVECAASLRLDDNELLGLSISEVNHLLPRPAVLCEAYEDGDERWECEELGLILWVEDGVVASATVSSP
jgi:hypothetical protein